MEGSKSLPLLSLLTGAKSRAEKWRFKRAIQATFAGGAIISENPGASLMVYRMNTNAPSVDDLQGKGYQIGGSFGAIVDGAPLAAGGEINILYNQTSDQYYYGATVGIGAGTPGIEGHVELGETTTIFSINVLS